MRTVLRQLGPGKFDAELFLDGKAFRPDGKIGGHADPAGVRSGRREPAHVDRLGIGHALERVRRQPRDARPGDVLRSAAERCRCSSRSRRANGFGNVRKLRDLITSKLAALQFYQLAIPAPAPPAERFDHAAAARGKGLFNGKARCATCHVPPLFTEPGWNMHTPQEIGIDNFQADRSPDRPLPDVAAQGTLDAHERRVLSRRPLRDPARCGRTTTTAFSG